MVKNPPANAGDSGDMGPLSLSWEDPLEEELATCSNILAMEGTGREGNLGGGVAE